jgi:uncharacterized Ntn-hydrolase superfamily protein
MTFSIVARDPQTGELGIAVQSKFLAVGAVVPWAKAGVMQGINLMSTTLSPSLPPDDTADVVL